MTTIDNIMALADQYMGWGCASDRQALRAAIEAALKPGEPVAWMYFDSDGDAIFGHPNGYRPSDAVPVYTAPAVRSNEK
jgi:hypothetical protein